MSQAIAIREDHPSNPAIVQLIEKLDHFQSKLYPAESNHLLPIERLAASDVYLCSCTLDGVICGCGCFWMHDQFVEIKRMFVDESCRGRGMGKKILEHLEQRARILGYRSARLETGIHQEPAIKMYRKLGYRFIPPFGAYLPDPLSVFMEKSLIPTSNKTPSPLTREPDGSCT